MKKTPTILIVDDEPIAQDTLSDLLLIQGYHLLCANNGPEALKKMEKIRPDLILLDVMMPHMDGFEVCQKLKSDPQWQHIPIILVTALDGKDDLVRGLDAGADDFLSKPVNRMELRARVRSMLRIKTQYDTLQKQQQDLEQALEMNQQFSQVFAQQLEALEILHEASLQLMNNLDMESVLNLIAETAIDLIPEAAGCIIHFVPHKEQVPLPVLFSPHTHSKMIYPSLGLEDIVQDVIQSQTPLTLADIHQEQINLQIPEMRAILMAPLIDNQQSLGTLTLYSTEAGTFGPIHQYIISILATQSAVAITKARHIKEKELAQEKEKQDIRSMFQRYVSPAVVERLVDDQANLALGGQRQEITVLFADIRGFTTFSSQLPPESVLEVLNQYLALAVAPIMKEEGTLDKFMGDAVMAIFNAPLPQSDGPIRAVRAALAMQQAIVSYNLKQMDHQALSFGIGINVGPAVVGNIGTAQQMNYTAIGDTINLAKRLQENAQGGQILLSQATYEAVQEIVQVEALGPLAIKGRAAEPAYRVIELKK